MFSILGLGCRRTRRFHEGAATTLLTVVATATVRGKNLSHHTYTKEDTHVIGFRFQGLISGFGLYVILEGFGPDFGDD